MRVFLQNGANLSGMDRRWTGNEPASVRAYSMLSSLRYIICLFAVLLMLGVNTVWALDEYVTVQDFDGSTTYSGSNMNSISGGNFSKTSNHVTFVINGVSYLSGTGLTYGFESANNTVNSQFSWSTETNYEVAVSKVSIGLKGYQAKLSYRLNSG